jgi:hypothetical protein
VKIVLDSVVDTEATTPLAGDDSAADSLSDVDVTSPLPLLVTLV